MALQRDFETLKEKNDSEKQPVCTNPLSILKVVMKQCKNMQERMLSQLAAAESRHRKVGSPISRCVLWESSEASVNNASSPARHQVSWDSDGAGDLLGIERSFSDTGARGTQKEPRWLHGFSLRIGPDIPAGDIPLCVALQNTWCILFSDLNLPNFGNKRVFDQAFSWTERSLFAYLSDK